MNNCNVQGLQLMAILYKQNINPENQWPPKTTVVSLFWLYLTAFYNIWSKKTGLLSISKVYSLFSKNVHLVIFFYLSKNAVISPSCHCIEILIYPTWFSSNIPSFRKFSGTPKLEITIFFGIYKNTSHLLLLSCLLLCSQVVFFGGQGLLFILSFSIKSRKSLEHNRYIRGMY